jgi:hypothetical protein
MELELAVLGIVDTVVGPSEEVAFLGTDETMEELEPPVPVVNIGREVELLSVISGIVPGIDVEFPIG